MAKARNYCFTSYQDEPPVFDPLVHKYLCYSPEVCPETGRHHWQGFICFINQATISAIQKRGYVFGFLKAPDGTFVQNRVYCGAEAYEKDGKFKEKNLAFQEFGVLPADPKLKGELGKREFELTLERARVGDFEYIDAEHYLKYYSAIHKIAGEHPVKPAALLGVRGTHHEWHYGPPGCGKTHYLESIPDLYTHEGGKWWDGYQGEKNVLFDDVDESSSKFVKEFKHLGNQTPFRVQVKFGMMYIRPEHAYISSNCEPGVIWTGVHLEAIVDRYKLIYWPYKFSDPRWFNPVTGETHASIAHGGGVGTPPLSPSVPRVTSLTTHPDLSILLSAAGRVGGLGAVAPISSRPSSPLCLSDLS